jgi:hypothetical protein
MNVGIRSKALGLLLLVACLYFSGSHLQGSTATVSTGASTAIASAARSLR